MFFYSLCSLSEISVIIKIQKESNFSFAGFVNILSREVNNEYAFSFEPIRFLNRLNMYNWQYKEWSNFIYTLSHTLKSPVLLSISKTIEKNKQVYCDNLKIAQASLDITG